MNTTPRRSFSLFPLNRPTILALFALAASTPGATTTCRGGEQPSSDINPTGVYRFVSVDGKTVPCNISHEGMTMSIKSGVFTIGADGTCSSLMKFSVASQEEVSRKVKATYTRKGKELTMHWEGAGTTVGKVDGNNFTMTNEGMILSYQK